MKKKSYEKYAEKYNALESQDLKRKRYRYDPRQSDSIMIEMVADTLQKLPAPHSLMDFCCGYGNLLYNLKHKFRSVKLHGADLAPGIIAQNKKDEELKGIKFNVGDVTDRAFTKSLGGPFDVVTINAATQMMDLESLMRLIKNVNSILKVGGCFINFDCYQKFHNGLHIISYTDRHPEGLIKYFHNKGIIEKITKAIRDF